MHQEISDPLTEVGGTFSHAYTTSKVHFSMKHPITKQNTWYSVQVKVFQNADSLVVSCLCTDSCPTCRSDGTFLWKKVIFLMINVFQDLNLCDCNIATSVSGNTDYKSQFEIETQNRSGSVCRLCGMIHWAMKKKAWEFLIRLQSDLGLHPVIKLCVATPLPGVIGDCWILFPHAITTDSSSCCHSR